MPKTLLDIAANMGGAQPALIDAITSKNGGALFRLLPMKSVVGMAEQFTRKTGRPTVGFRNLGGDVTASKSKKVPMQESIFLLSGASESDVQKVDKSADPEQERIEDAADFLESMGYSLSRSAFYGSNRVDGGYDGLLKRLPNTGCDTYIGGGATNETVSIYAFCFGPKQFMGLYNPFNNGDIIEAHDYGRVAVKENGVYTENYVTMFNACFGLAQYHPLAVARLGKLDSSHKPTSSLMTDLFNAMGQKPDLLVTTMKGAGWLGELKQSVMKMAPTDMNFDISMNDYEGIPVIVDAALVNDESAITL